MNIVVDGLGEPLIAVGGFGGSPSVTEPLLTDVDPLQFVVLDGDDGDDDTQIGNIDPVAFVVLA